MKFWILIVLCLVQGLTEFLPVSSSGHLLLFEQIFHIEGNLLLLNLFLHLATLLAVVIIYRKVIWKIIKKPFQPLTYKLLISTLITLVFAGLYEVLNIDRYVSWVYGFCFLITASVLYAAFVFQKRSSVVRAGEVSYKRAAIVGAVQGFAVLPGISRSGSTICSLLFCGSSEGEAAEYSFLLSIPIILGGFVFELLKVDNFQSLFSGISVWMLVFAFVFTFLVSLLSIKLTVKLLKDRKFNFFAFYLIFVGILAIILTFI